MRQRTQRCYVYTSKTTICIVFKLPRFGIILYTAVGNQYRKVLIKLNMNISNSPGIPLLKTYLNENICSQKTYTKMFIATLCSSVCELNKHFVLTIDSYSDIKGSKHGARHDVTWL